MLINTRENAKDTVKQFNKFQTDKKYKQSSVKISSSSNKTKDFEKKSDASNSKIKISA